jgi:DtxR family transcriptional regulator, Mn-dependent transcriptional regulator
MQHEKNDHHPEKPLTSTMEDYLEAIFDLDRDKKVVRVKDIAKKLDVKMPSVTSMLKTLSDRGLVAYEKYEYVELTDEGSGVGQEMHRRHGVLRKFLTDILKIDPVTADEEACRMEHSLSAGTLNSLTDFIAYVQTCPRAGENWLRHFEDFRQHGYRPEKCVKRTEKFACELEEETEVEKKE